jgi:poly-gamma-glutamate capsule biosynthesis protein CapA/YwtB (metallophosphatase superfamily)
VNLFLCGDVMTGRGIDQILPHPSKPVLYKRYLKSAMTYIELAEAVSGPIPRPVDFDYVWGDALEELRLRQPDLSVVNLETSVTTAEEAAPKGINYRMHPANVPCLRAGGIACCVLANNHVLDWGTAGLLETISSLKSAGIATAGAGSTSKEAARPATLKTPSGRHVLVFACGSTCSGVPPGWAATPSRPGVSVLPRVSEEQAERLLAQIESYRSEGDVVIVSVHWGDNWGYAIPSAQRRFAHRLIEAGSVDVVHGHSSHHVKGIEVYREKLILYGSGDFITDYEGTPGHEEYRADLILAYFAALEPSGRLERLEMVPFRMRRFRLERATDADAEWLQEMLTSEGKGLGTSVQPGLGGVLALRW